MFFISNPLEQIVSDSIFNFFFYRSGLFLDFTFTNYSLTALILLFFLIIFVNIFSFYYLKKTNYYTTKVKIRQENNNLIKNGSKLNFIPKQGLNQKSKLSFLKSKVRCHFFSTQSGPEKSGLFRRFQKRRDAFFYALVHNKENLQYKVLLCHAGVVLGVCATISQDFYLVALTVYFCCLIGLIARLLLGLVQFIKTRPVYIVIVGFVVFQGLIVSQAYEILFFYLGVFLYVYLKNAYVNFELNFKKVEDASFIVRLSHDVAVMSHHLNLEFRLFNELQKTNNFLLLAYISSRYLEEEHRLPLGDLTESTFMHVMYLVSLVFIFNSLLFIAVRFTVSRYCNSDSQ